MRFICVIWFLLLMQSGFLLWGEDVKLFLRPEKESKKISLIIPCYYRHALHLGHLLSLYENQTQLPDEVIITLSEVHLVNKDILEQLQNRLYAFPVKLLVTQEKKHAGQNRNYACQHARGDVVVCQDADDIPHPQRIEIIHYFFSTYEIDHLIHHYVLMPKGKTEDPFVWCADFEKLSCGCTPKFATIWRQGRFTNGNVAIRRGVFDMVQWPDKQRGQDTAFNEAVYAKFNRCIFLEAALYGYRQYLSSAAKEEKVVEVPGKVVYTIERDRRYPIKVIELKS